MIETSPRPRPRARTGAAALTLAALPGCADQPQSMFPPGSTEAGVIADLWWFMFWLGSAVYLLVLLVLLVAIRRSKGRSAPGKRPPNYLIWSGGIVLPAVVIVVLAFLSFAASRAAAPSGQGGQADLVIEVTGHKFWWHVVYPEHGIVTANEITIPAGRRVEFVMESADVIHSLWVPRLHGKIDMTPGHTTHLQVSADEPGVYRGQCAEYCGTQHANMAFFVEALPPDEFDLWVESRQQGPGPAGLAARRGQEVFVDAGCAACHGANGSPAEEVVGPDLTHLMSRRTIGAGTVANNRGNLGGWVVDPQTIKPGNLMPPTALQAQDLLDLLAYLETLR